MIVMFTIIVAVMTIAGMALLNALMHGSSVGRRGAVIVAFLSFLAWSWTMAYFIATKQ